MDKASKQISLKQAFAEEYVAVTVICVTYNHEKYIAEALESFVNQETNFPYKIFVGDDASQDSTPEIVRRFATLYPEKVVPFIRDENMGPVANFIDMTKHASSPYIAICDGDDYWIDTLKLQKQFDYMQENPELQFSYARSKFLTPVNWEFGDYYEMDRSGDYIIPDCIPGRREDQDLTFSCFDIGGRDALQFGHTSTYFFKWNYDIEYPQWFFQGLMGDIPIRLMQLGCGKYGSIEDVVSVYRISEVGIYGKFKSRDELFLNTRNV